MNTLSVTFLLLIVYFGISLYLVKDIALRIKELAICGIYDCTDSDPGFHPNSPSHRSNHVFMFSCPPSSVSYFMESKVGYRFRLGLRYTALLLVPAWQPVHWGQIFAEHLVCFSGLGYAGCFGNHKRWKILCGILLASVIRICGHTLSGVLFFSQNAWDGWSAWGYSLAYNFSQNIPLCLMSGAIVLVLPLGSLKHVIGKGRLV